MRFDKLTMKSQEILQGAMGLAERKGNPQIEPVHLLAILMQVSEDIARPIAGKLGVNQNALAADIEKAVQALPQVKGTAQQAHLSPAALDVLNSAETQAENMKDEYTSVEHLLLALAQSKEAGREPICAQHGLTADAVMGVLKDIRGTQRVTDQNRRRTNTRL